MFPNYSLLHFILEDPPKSELIRGTLIKFSPLNKGGWGGSDTSQTSSENRFLETKTLFLEFITHYFLAVCKKEGVSNRKRMNLPTLRSTDRTQMTERRHSDPPALWTTVILSSVVFHLFAVGMLRLLLMGRLYGLQSGTTLVPVDVVSIDPNVTLSTQPTQTPGSVATRTSTPRNNSNRRANRSTASVPTPSSTRTNTGTTKVASSPIAQRSPTTKPYPTQPSDLPSEPISRNPSQNQTPSPAPRPTSANTSPSQPSAPAPEPPAPNPSPSQPPTPVPSPTSPSPQPGGGILVSSVLPGPNSPSPLTIEGSLGADTISKLARIKTQREDFPPGSSVAQLASNLNQDLTLEVILEIDRTGKATIKSVESTSQVNSTVNVTDLAKGIIQNWEFEPSYDKQDKPFDQAYRLGLKITRQLQ